MASTSSSASDSQYCPRWKYDVFINFRGEDTRKTFTSHLYEGLKNKGIFTFQDDKRLEYGDSIPDELLKAIEESRVAIVVFSKNFATSSWCLNELVKIRECNDKNGQLVIPVFYDVDPSHIRKQTESFDVAFTEHEKKYKDDVEGMQKVKAWRTALTAVVDLSGCAVRDRTESECIRDIVDQVSSKLCNTSLSYLQDIVGINTHLEKVKSLLEMEINDVRIVGIWGMGGIGKTTIARAIFDTLSPKFDGASFLGDIKENKEMHSLQNILLSELLRGEKNSVNNKEGGKRLMASRLRSMKVLVVLDDINHRDHWGYLAGDLHWFGNGSRIIATTRDKQIIGKNNVVYEVTTLPEHDAIQLFNQYAFKDEAPNKDIKKLALEVVSHAKGLPIALKLWGSLLHNKPTTMWRDVIDMIKTESSPDIVKNLTISYEGLEDKEKMIFLDIACFLRGMVKDEIIEILESYDLHAGIRLHGLIEKSLVFISTYNTIQMHDLIQDMGRYVMTIQKNAGNCSRIWDNEDFEEVMVNNTGTKAMEAIWIDSVQKLCFSKIVMKDMKRLRILHISGFDTHDDSIEYLPNSLRWFEFYQYPSESLPENFEPKRLVHLDLRHSSLRHLWIETKALLPSLRKLNLNCSKNLMQTPDFTGMPNLEYLNLEECTSLEEIHPSLGYCKKLIWLDLFHCESLKRFPCVNVESLEYLNLRFCSSLEKFPEILGTMKPEFEIHMESCGIREIPQSFIHHQAHITELNLRFMENLVALPSSICKLKGLVKLKVSSCSKLESLPEEIGDLENLEELNASYTLISRPPSSIVRLNKLTFLSFEIEESEDGVFFVFPQVNEGLRSLEQLNLSGCNLIDGGLPEDIGCLSYLEDLDLTGSNFEHLPRSIAQLGSLRSLNLQYCNRLKELPDFTGMQCLETLKLNYCNLIDGVLPEDIGCLSSLKELDLSGNNFEHLPRSIAQLRALRSLNLSDCKRLTQLPEFPEQLDTIDADWSNDWICNSLFQNISSLQHDIFASDSLSLRVCTSRGENIPSWFHHQGTGKSVSVNLPENWYVSDKFLGFAVCYTGRLIDTKAHLISFCNDDISWMTQKLALSNDLKWSSYSEIHFFLVPFPGLWDMSKANGETPNDYGRIMLSSSGEIEKLGLRFLYEDEPNLESLLQMRETNDEPTEHSIGTRRSRYDDSEHHDEASCSSSKKQRSHSNVRVSSVFENLQQQPVSSETLQLFPTTPGI